MLRKNNGMSVAQTVLRGCHQLGKLGSANHHPLKKPFPRQAVLVQGIVWGGLWIIDNKKVATILDSSYFFLGVCQIIMALFAQCLLCLLCLL
jgi:hypothetical protein